MNSHREFRRRQFARHFRTLDRLEARPTVVEVLFSAIAGLALRAAPVEVRDQIIRELRASVTNDASGLELEPEVLQIEELTAQVIDAIEGYARGQS
jgi:hypothetical protein